MDIRYFRLNQLSVYYAATEKPESIMAFGDSGKLIYDAGGRFESLESGFTEILPPDVDLIEERHINATDRPSREGFKHPDVVEPWSKVLEAL